MPIDNKCYNQRIGKHDNLKYDKKTSSFKNDLNTINQVRNPIEFLQTIDQITTRETACQVERYPEYKKADAFLSVIQLLSLARVPEPLSLQPSSFYKNATSDVKYATKSLGLVDAEIKTTPIVENLLYNEKLNNISHFSELIPSSLSCLGILSNNPIVKSTSTVLCGLSQINSARASPQHRAFTAIETVKGKNISEEQRAEIEKISIDTRALLDDYPTSFPNGVQEGLLFITDFMLVLSNNSEAMSLYKTASEKFLNTFDGNNLNSSRDAFIADLKESNYWSNNDPDCWRAFFKVISNDKKGNLYRHTNREKRHIHKLLQPKGSHIIPKQSEKVEEKINAHYVKIHQNIKEYLHKYNKDYHNLKKEDYREIHDIVHKHAAPHIAESLLDDHPDKLSIKQIDLHEDSKKRSDYLLEKHEGKEKNIFKAEEGTSISEHAKELSTALFFGKNMDVSDAELHQKIVEECGFWDVVDPGKDLIAQGAQISKDLTTLLGIRSFTEKSEEKFKQDYFDQIYHEWLSPRSTGVGIQDGIAMALIGGIILPSCVARVSKDVAAGLRTTTMSVKEIAACNFAVTTLQLGLTMGLPFGAAIPGIGAFMHSAAHGKATFCNTAKIVIGVIASGKVPEMGEAGEAGELGEYSSHTEKVENFNKFREENNLLNEKKTLITEEDILINDKGELVNEKGERVNRDSDLVNEDGSLIKSKGIHEADTSAFALQLENKMSIIKLIEELKTTEIYGLLKINEQKLPLIESEGTFNLEGFDGEVQVRYVKNVEGELQLEKIKFEPIENSPILTLRAKLKILFRKIKKPEDVLSPRDQVALKRLLENGRNLSKTDANLFNEYYWTGYSKGSPNIKMQLVKIYNALKNTRELSLSKLEKLATKVNEHGFNPLIANILEHEMVEFNTKSLSEKIKIVSEIKNILSASKEISEGRTLLESELKSHFSLYDRINKDGGINKFPESELSLETEGLSQYRVRKYKLQEAGEIKNLYLDSPIPPTKQLRLSLSETGELITHQKLGGVEKSVSDGAYMFRITESNSDIVLLFEMKDSWSEYAFDDKKSFLTGKCSFKNGEMESWTSDKLEFNPSELKESIQTNDLFSENTFEKTVLGDEGTYILPSKIKKHLLPEPFDTFKQLEEMELPGKHFLRLDSIIKDKIKLLKNKKAHEINLEYRALSEKFGLIKLEPIRKHYQELLYSELGDVPIEEASEAITILGHLLKEKSIDSPFVSHFLFKPFEEQIILLEKKQPIYMIKSDCENNSLENSRIVKKVLKKNLWKLLTINSSIQKEGIPKAICL